MSNSKFDNACNFARAAVADMLIAVTNHSSAARLRLTGENRPHQFVWIMIERYTPSNTAGSTTETRISARTNDADFMVGYPPSLNLDAPLSQAQDLQDPIIAFLEHEIAHYGKVEALMQSEALDRSYRPNFVGDSESGYDAAHVMTSIDTP